MRTAALFSYIAAACFLPSIALACSSDYGFLSHDRDIFVRVDGDFQYAAGGDRVQNFTGRSVVNIGGGRVAQRITRGEGCGTIEQLVLADCSTTEVVSFYGREDPKRDPNAPLIATNSVVRTEFIQPPYSPIAFTAESTIQDAIVMARSGDVRQNSRFLDQISRMRPNNRFDPFFGYAPFYPDLPGAS